MTSRSFPTRLRLVAAGVAVAAVLWFGATFPREDFRPPVRSAPARILLASGRRDEARAQLERLVREDSEHPDAVLAVRSLEDLADEDGDAATAQTLRELRGRMGRP